MKKFDNLLERDFHIVEKRKIIFAIPLVIIFVAAVMMIIFNFTLGSPLNLGTDFTGGYSIDIKLGNKLTSANYDAYCERIKDVMSSVKAEDGEELSIRVDNMQMQGSGDSGAIHVKYYALKGVSEPEMISKVNPAIQSALEDSVLKIIPDTKIDGNKIYITYNDVLSEPAFADQSETFKKSIESLNEKHGAAIVLSEDEAEAIVLNADNKKQIIITCENSVNVSDALTEAITDVMKINDEYAGSVTQGDLVGATVSTELIFNAVLAVALALVFMLCYIGIRFQLSSGLACIIALFHDILIMFSFMAICRIEINNTFIAALITILGYSINNSIIIFDRVRENTKSIYSKEMTSEQVANKSIRETLLRSINTTITTLIMILMVAIIGVEDIKIFAFPIIIGLIAGTFSSICIAPSFWALFQRVGKNKKNFHIDSKPSRDKTDKKAKTAEIGA